MTTRGEFFLIEFDNCKQPISISFENAEINFSTDIQKTNEFSRIKQSYDKISETGLLTISGPNYERALSIAIDIKNLLSLALGKSIIFNRWKLYENGKKELVTKPMVRNYNRGVQIIPDFELKNFLEQTLPNYKTFSKELKDEYFIITDYLNQTSFGYIEDRLMRIVQAWECAATYWTNEVELSEELKDLRKRILLTFKEWKNEIEFIDFNGELGTKLGSVINHEKLITRINNFVNESGLRTEKNPIDFRALKKLRDKAAHTGKIHLDGKEAIDYLMPGIKGLQLILLKKLDYNGKIYGSKDNWQSLDYIQEYFIN